MMSKYKRLIIDLGYVVDSGDDDMIQHAKECFYEDVINLNKWNELFETITLVDAPDASEKDVPEFLLEREYEEWDGSKWLEELNK